jgi:hypothetical protein
MTIIPAVLNPAGETEFLLPSGRTIGLPRARPVFAPWTGDRPAETANRAILDYQGRPAVAELACLWAIHASGWQGVWIDHDRGVYRTELTGVSPPQSLPAEAEALLRRINESSRKHKGAWDLFCWRDDSVLFALVKRHKEDRFNAAQLRWLEAALMTGLASDSFLVIEWTLEGK